MTLRTNFFVIAMAISLASNSNASIVSPDWATASSFFPGPGFLPENTINGSGLPANFTSTDSHNFYFAQEDNHWTTGPNTTPTDQSITWGFNTPQSLDAIHIWNHQSTVRPIGFANNPGYDVTLFDLTIIDSSNIVVGFLNDVPLAPDIAIAQTIPLGGVFSNVSKVTFEIESIQESSSPYTGLAEVAFNVAAHPNTENVPEPTSLIVWALLATLGIQRKRSGRPVRA